MCVCVCVYVCASPLPCLHSSFPMAFSSENSHSLCKVPSRHFLWLPRVIKQWFYDLSLVNWTLDYTVMMKEALELPSVAIPGRTFPLRPYDGSCLSLTGFCDFLFYPWVPQIFLADSLFLLLSSSALVSVACNQNKAHVLSWFFEFPSKVKLHLPTMEMCSSLLLSFLLFSPDQYFLGPHPKETQRSSGGMH